MSTKIEINGIAYYTCEAFAELIGKHVNTVFTLISRGNNIRKLKAIKVGGKPFIPITEYTEFPFTKHGPNSQHRVYHYTPDGHAVLCALCSEKGEDAHAR